MHINDAVFLEDLCPKLRFRQWRKSIHRFTGKIVFIVVIHLNRLIMYYLKVRGIKYYYKIAFQPVYHAMEINLMKMPCIGTEGKSFMTQEEQWLLEHG